MSEILPWFLLENPSGDFFFREIPSRTLPENQNAFRNVVKKFESTEAS